MEVEVNLKFCRQNRRKLEEHSRKMESFDELNKKSSAIDFDTYEKLHRKQLDQSVNPNWKGFGLTKN